MIGAAQAAVAFLGGFDFCDRTHLAPPLVAEVRRLCWTTCRIRGMASYGGGAPAHRLYSCLPVGERRSRMTRIGDSPRNGRSLIL